MKRNALLIMVLILCWLCGAAGNLPVSAAAGDTPADTTEESGKENGESILKLPDSSFFENEDLSLAIKIMLVMSVLTLLPAIVLTMTSFTRIIIILSFVKRAMGTQDLPPNQIVVGFAIFLTIAIMAPVFIQINETAIEPYRQEKITFGEAAEKAGDAMKTFLLKQTRPDDIALMVHIAKVKRPAMPEDTPIYILVPAFALSELKTAFQMGFIIFLPFLIIDIVIASVLLSMGMFMLPPIIISTPFKIILFVLVDGWTLVITSLVRSFGV